MGHCCEKKIHQSIFYRKLFLKIKYATLFLLEMILKFFPTVFVKYVSHMESQQPQSKKQNAVFPN